MLDNEEGIYIEIDFNLFSCKAGCGKTQHEDNEILYVGWVCPECIEKSLKEK